MRYMRPKSNTLLNDLMFYFLLVSSTWTLLRSSAPEIVFHFRFRGFFFLLWFSLLIWILSFPLHCQGNCFNDLALLTNSLFSLKFINFKIVELQINSNSLYVNVLAFTNQFGIFIRFKFFIWAAIKEFSFWSSQNTEKCTHSEWHSQTHSKPGDIENESLNGVHRLFLKRWRRSE